MENDDKLAASMIFDKPERKVIEKNRRNHIKFLYFQLFSLLPGVATSKGSMQISDRIDEAIQYIESLKANLEITRNNKKQKLLRNKRLNEYTKSDSHGASTSQSLVIQIHELSPDADVVLISGLKIHSLFYDVIRVLDEYSTELVHANFSSCGPSTFYVHHKKIEAAEIYRRLNGLFGVTSKIEELDNQAPSCKEEEEGDLNLWDFEICTDVCFRNY